MTRSAIRCPVCSRAQTDATFRPFCSSRCRQLDLGRWLTGRYRLAGDRHDPRATLDTLDEHGTEESK